MRDASRKAATFGRLLWFSGLFNIVLAAPLALPWTIGPYLRVLSELDARLGLGGRPLEAPSGSLAALLGNTAGIDLVLIGIFVLYAARDPARRAFLVATNAVARLLFAGLLGYYVWASDVARVVLAIGAIDVALGVGLLFILLRSPRRDRTEPATA